MFGISIKSSKYRFFIFLAVLLVSMLLVYKIALGITVDLFGENMELAERLENINTKTEIDNNLDYMSFQKYIIPSDSIFYYKNILFSSIEKTSVRCEIELIEYLSLKDFIIKEGRIMTQKLELSGDYVSLMNALVIIEDLELKHKLNSVRFIKTKNIKTKRDELILELFFQAIVKN